MTMTYQPSWEKSSNRWDTEPDFWELLEKEEEEKENAKNANDISLEDLAEEELELEEDFDL